MTALPAAPDRTAPLTFATRGNNLVAALPTFVTEANALQNDVNAKQTQTGLDRVATGQDRVQTGLDRIATGQDRVQTGLDRTATGDSATAAAASRLAIDRRIYPTARSTDPTTREDATASQMGDQYYNNSATPGRWRVVSAVGPLVWGDSTAEAIAAAAAALVSQGAANTSKLAVDQGLIDTTAQKTLAVTARTGSEAARDAANTVGKVFTSTALGIAGTTSGQSFSVLSADLLDLIVYTNAAGTATELFRFKTKAFIDSLGLDPTSYSSRSGYAYAWLDTSNQMALGIRNDGKVILGNGGDITAAVAAINTALTTLPTLTNSEYDRSGYFWAWQDSAGNVAGGLDSAGNLITKGNNLNATLLGGAGYERSGYVWGVQDEAGRIAFGLDATGTLLVKGVAIGGSAQTDINTAAIAALGKWITPSGFWCYGDSLTAGAGGTPYPSQLATLLGKTVANAGVGGQTAFNISGRFGGSVALLTVTGNSIPASGAVAVTAQTFQLHNNQGPGAITGTLGGIPGTLNATAFDGSGVPTAVNFTRTNAGTATAIEPAAPFLVDSSDNRQFGTVVFWYGRNDAGTAGFNANIKQAIAESVAQLKTQDQRFVVMSVLNTNTEVSGSGIWTAITQLTADLKALYPRNFLDVRARLVRSGTGTGQDATDAANDVVPASLRSDSIHLNTAGYGVVANALYQFLQTKGWN